MTLLSIFASAAIATFSLARYAVLVVALVILDQQPQEAQPPNGGYLKAWAETIFFAALALVSAGACGFIIGNR